MPCAISLKVPPEAYSHEMVQYLDAHLPRESVTHITLLVDTRPHQGYDNNNAFWMWQHIVLLAKMFQHNFPERLARILTYPVSKFEILVWRGLRPLLSATTRNKVELLAGRYSDPLPKQLWDYVSLSQILPENHCFFDIVSNVAGAADTQDKAADMEMDMKVDKWHLNVVGVPWHGGA